jgi:prepilin-type N-terminal cleavage/methylation domain-containing protein
MKNCCRLLLPIKHKIEQGFTLVELLITIAVLAITTVIALPALTEFTVKIRVDNQISELHRLLLLTRNTAVNDEQNITICPLDNTNNCSKNWDQVITVFKDLDQDGRYEAADNETIVQIKSAIANDDSLQYDQTSLVYTATGNLANGASDSPFTYCPNTFKKFSRGILVSSSGRSYLSADTDNDGIDEDRYGNEITCSS